MSLLLLIRLLLAVVACTILLAAAVFDIRKRIIPDRLVGLLAVGGLALGLASVPGQVWIRIVVALGVLIGLGFLSHFKLIGGGDVKLISASTLLVPPGAVAGLLVDIFLIGGALSLGYGLAFQLAKHRPKLVPVRVTGGRQRPLRRLLELERRRILHTRSMPFGVAVLLGAIIHIVSEFSNALP